MPAPTVDAISSGLGQSNSQEPTTDDIRAALGQSASSQGPTADDIRAALNGPTSTPDRGTARSLVDHYAKQYGVPADFADRLVRQESGYNQAARSKTGAIGVMQLEPGTAKMLGVNPYDMEDNIRGGMQYLGGFFKKYGGDPYKVAVAYNAGPGSAGLSYDRLPGETQQYVRNVALYNPSRGGAAGYHMRLPAPKNGNGGLFSPIDPLKAPPSVLPELPLPAQSAARAPAPGRPLTASPQEVPQVRNAASMTRHVPWAQARANLEAAPKAPPVALGTLENLGKEFLQGESSPMGFLGKAAVQPLVDQARQLGPQSPQEKQAAETYRQALVKMIRDPVARARFKNADIGTLGDVLYSQGVGTQGETGLQQMFKAGHIDKPTYDALSGVEQRGESFVGGMVPFGGVAVGARYGRSPQAELEQETKENPFAVPAQVAMAGLPFLHAAIPGLEGARSSVAVKPGEAPTAEEIAHALNTTEQPVHPPQSTPTPEPAPVIRHPRFGVVRVVKPTTEMGGPLTGKVTGGAEPGVVVKSSKGFHTVPAGELSADQVQHTASFAGKPPVSVEAPTDRLASIMGELKQQGMPPASAGAMARMVDRALSNIDSAKAALKPGNDIPRAIWERETGVKLPEDGAGTNEAIEAHFSAHPQIPGGEVAQGAVEPPTAQEIAHALSAPEQPVQPPAAVSASSPTDLAARTLGSLKPGQAIHADDIANATGLTAAQVSTGLTLNEMAGQAQRVPGNRFQLAGEEPIGTVPANAAARRAAATKAARGSKVPVAAPTTEPLRASTRGTNRIPPPVPPPVREAPAPAEGATAPPTHPVYTPDNQPVDYHWEVRPVSDILTSHTDNFGESPGYDQGLQERERGRAAPVEQVLHLSENATPDRLGESPTTADGAPVVGPDMQAESGNGRMMGLRMAYAKDNQVASQYRDFVLHEGARLGMDPDALAKIDDPVLVRVRDTPVEEGAPRYDLARRMGRQTAATMSEPEQAASDAYRMQQSGILDNLSPDNPDLNAASNRHFVRSFVQGLSPAEKGIVQQEDGSLSAAGLRRMRNGLLAGAYGQGAALERLTEATDDNVRGVGNGMVQAAPAFSRLRANIENGTRWKSLDITKDIADAANTLSYLRAERIPVKDYLAQQQLYGELSPVAEELLSQFDKYKSKPKAVALLLTNYARAADLAGNPQEGSLFGEQEAPSAADALTAAIRHTEDHYESESAQSPALDFAATAEPETRTSAPPTPAGNTPIPGAEAARGEPAGGSGSARPAGAPATPSAGGGISPDNDALRNAGTENVAPPSAAAALAQKAHDYAESVKSDILSDLKGKVSSGIDPATLARLALYGGAKIVEGLANFADWSAHMVDTFGNSIRPYLADLWDRSKGQARATGITIPGEEVRPGGEPSGNSRPAVANPIPTPINRNLAPGAAFRFARERVGDAAGRMSVDPRVLGDSWARAKNGVDSSLNMLKRYGSPQSVNAVRELAGTRGLVNTLINRDLLEIDTTLGSPAEGQLFRMALLESRLRGVRGRWQSLAQDAATAPHDGFLDEQGNLPPRYVRALGAFEEGNANAKGQGALVQALADEAQATGDHSALRDFLHEAFSEAADRTAMALPPAVYDAVTSNPKFQPALTIFKNHIEQQMAQSHAQNEGVFSDALGPLDTYYPLIRSSDNARPNTGSLMEIAKPKNRQNAFATGQGAAYDASALGLRKFIQTTLHRNARANMMAQFEEEGLVADPTAANVEQVGPGRWNYSVRGKDFPARELPTAPDTMTIHDGNPVYTPAPRKIVPGWLMKEIGPLVHDELPEWGASELKLPLVSPGLKALNWAALVLNPLTVTLHWANLWGVYYSEALGPRLMSPLIEGRMRDFGRNTASLFHLSPDLAMQTEREMGQLGVLPERLGEVTTSKRAAESTGAEYRNPVMGAGHQLLFGPNGIDITIRRQMFMAAKAMAGLDPLKPFDPKADPAAAQRVAEFTDRLGVYVPGLQSDLVRGLRETGLNPFGVASTNMLKAGVRYFGRALDPTSLPTAGRGAGRMVAYKLAQQALPVVSGGAVALLSGWATVHHALTGKWPWQDPNSRFLQLPVPERIRKSKLGQIIWGPGDQTAYVNMGAVNPVAQRGANALGITNAYNARMQGASTGITEEEALRGAINGFTQPLVEGPGARALLGAALMQQPYITSLRDPQTGKPGAQFWQDYPALKPGLNVPARLASAANASNAMTGKALGVAGYGPEASDMSKLPAKGRYFNALASILAPRMIGGTQDQQGGERRFAKEDIMANLPGTSEQQQQTYQAIDSIRAQAQQGKPIAPAVGQLLRQGRISYAQAKSLMRYSNEPPATAALMALPIPQAIDAYKNAPPSMRPALTIPMRARIISLVRARAISADDFNKAKSAGIFEGAATSVAKR